MTPEARTWLVTVDIAATDVREAQHIVAKVQARTAQSALRVLVHTATENAHVWQIRVELIDEPLEDDA